MSEKMKTVYSGMLAIAVIGVSAFTVSCSSGNAVNPASPSVNQTAAPPTNRPAMSSANNPPGQPANSTRVSPSNSSRSGQDSTAKIAAILGIDQQKLENALIQARSELGGNKTFSPPAGAMPPSSTPPAGTVMPSLPANATGQPQNGAPQAAMSNELMAKLASILNIDQQKIEDAFAQAGGPQPAGQK